MNSEKQEVITHVNKDVPPLIHRWPKRFPYRISGASHPQPGDLALCGRRKVSPWSGKHGRDTVNCVVCLDLLKRL